MAYADQSPTGRRLQPKPRGESFVLLEELFGHNVAKRIEKLLCSAGSSPIRMIDPEKFSDTFMFGREVLLAQPPKDMVT